MKIGDNLMPHLALLTGSKVSNILFFALDSIFDPRDTRLKYSESRFGQVSVAHN